MSGFSVARQHMVDGQVRTNDVTDQRILDAMLAIPREDFVPDDKRALAYLDLDLDVAAPGAGGRFLIKPQVLAKMLQAAEIKASDHVLIVGDACGYVAALLARIAAQVSAVDNDPALVARGRAALGRLGLDGNAMIRVGAAPEGNPAGAPYDVIVLNGATEIAPQSLYGQLREGGRLVGVFANTRPARAVIVTRTHGDFGNRALFDASAPVLPGLEQLPAFVF